MSIYSFWKLGLARKSRPENGVTPRILCGGIRRHSPSHGIHILG